MEAFKQGIYQGDCVELLTAVPNESVDLVFADPPFNIGYQYDVYDDRKQADEYLEWCQRWIAGAFRVLKPDGTFWLAIGDEFAAELKIASQKAGFHCRSWVIWYYTFGVNCVNGFSRSHTHLFHFVKDKRNFKFRRLNPQVRVKSARQLVYADNRANPNGRLPDNTWIIRPQDAPLSFSPNHDTWYFARVAGTFKEREGFHGCQMPEQLLARIIRVSSDPQDVVLDPFSGSGTTLCVAKKLARQWIGFELSTEYVESIRERLQRTHVGDEIDGPEDPLQSSPSTANGKRKKKPFDEGTVNKVINAYQQSGEGYPADFILCDKELNRSFGKACASDGLGGSAAVWNRCLLQLRKSGKLPVSTRKPPKLSQNRQQMWGFACEVAWRLMEIDYRKSLDEILCSPDSAEEFDRLAALYGPQEDDFSATDCRRAALAIRKRMKRGRALAAEHLSDWYGRRKLQESDLTGLDSVPETPGVFVLYHGKNPVFAGESDNLRWQLRLVLSIPSWQGFELDKLRYTRPEDAGHHRDALKVAIVSHERPLLNLSQWAMSVPQPA